MLFFHRPNLFFKRARLFSIMILFSFFTFWSYFVSIFCCCVRLVVDSFNMSKSITAFIMYAQLDWKFTGSFVLLLLLLMFSFLLSLFFCLFVCFLHYKGNYMKINNRIFFWKKILYKEKIFLLDFMKNIKTKHVRFVYNIFLNFCFCRFNDGGIKN